MTEKQMTGARAEARAAAFLRSRGFHILEQNVRTPYGEIDLVCRDDQSLVFVEVRYRSSTSFGQPEETVVGRKLERVRQGAEWYVTQHYVQGDYRIDVLGMTGNPIVITHIQNASEGQAPITP